MLFHFNRPQSRIPIFTLSTNDTLIGPQETCGPTTPATFSPACALERTTCSAMILTSLPDHLQCKLDVPGLCRQVVHIPAAKRRSTRVKNPSAVEWLWRNKVGAIQDVEDLRAKLNVEGLRNATYWIVLGCGKIQVYKLGPNNGIAAGIAKEIRAINLARGRGESWKSAALGGKWRRSRYRRK